MARRCRLTSFFRIFVIIPIWIVLGTVSGGAWGWAGGIPFQHGLRERWRGRVVVPRPAADDLVQAEVPRWWFDWNLELQRFVNRTWTYLVLMNDSYPSTDDHQWVRLDYDLTGH